MPLAHGTGDRRNAGRRHSATFIATAERSIDSSIDARRLRRLVHLAQDLEDLAWRLSEGRQGLGRARLGMVLTAGSVAGWAGVVSQQPLRHAGGTGPDEGRPAAGDRPAGGPVAAIDRRPPPDASGTTRTGTSAGCGTARVPQHEHLGWRDLTPEERALCPPLFVIGGSDLLRGGGLSQIDKLLGSDLPIKLIY